jgi:16S rRNA (uracil1498-N3)-methyltransferase
VSRVTRVYCAGLDPVEPGLSLDGSAWRHVIQVLRLAPGDPLLLFDGRGNEYSAVLQTVARQQVRVGDLRLQRQEPRAALALRLWIGISRGERMDFALQKAVELGVADIRVFAARRSVVKLSGDKLDRRLQHWRGVVVGACEQSGRCWLPDLRMSDLPGAPLPEWRDDLKLLLHHRATRSLRDMTPAGGGVQLLVGPEGGLDERELAAVEHAGFVPVRLGPRVMRTETAPLAALAAVQTLWGDFT